MDIMQINANSGTIYPESSKNSGNFNNTTDPVAGGMLYGGNNSLSSDFNKNTSTTLKNSVKSGNIKIDSGNSNGNIVFGGDQDSLKEQSDTLMKQSALPHINEDVSEKLNSYRDQLNKWKEQRNNGELINNFGLDMNSQTVTENFVTEESGASEISGLNKSAQSNIATKAKSTQKRKGDENSSKERDISFEPISYQKQKKRNSSRTNRNDKSKRNSDNHTAEKSGGIDRKLTLKKDGEKVSKSKKEDKKPSGAGETVKKVAKTSLKTSSNVTTKGLMAMWGIGSTVVKQDILFRIILGLFVGTAFVTIVLVGG